MLFLNQQKYSKSCLKLSQVNVISRLMWSYFKRPIYKQLLNNYHRLLLSFSYNVTNFDLAQSDYINWLLLYFGNATTPFSKCMLKERVSTWLKYAKNILNLNGHMKAAGIEMVFRYTYLFRHFCGLTRLEEKRHMD